MGYELTQILIPITSFSKSGGMRVLSKLANEWCESGYIVTFVSPFESEKPYYPTKAKIVWIDNQGNIVPSNSNDFIIRKSAKRRMLALYRYLKNYQIMNSIIIANHNLTVWPIWFAKKRNQSCIYYIQAYEPEFDRVHDIKTLLKYLMAYMTYYLPFVQIVNADIYKQYKNIRTDHVIPPGLDLTVYHQKTNSVYKNIRNDRIIIGCIGRTQEWKGSNDVGRAVQILHQKGYDNIHLKVAFNQIEYENCELVFPDGDANLADYYRSLDILVAPGHIQLGAVHYPVIEAMACKVPVITTGYYPANNENSYIVPIQNPERIAETILEIINNPEEVEVKVERALKEVKRFDWKIVSSDFLDIIKAEYLRKGIMK